MEILCPSNPNCMPMEFLFIAYENRIFPRSFFSRKKNDNNPSTEVLLFPGFLPGFPAGGENSIKKPSPERLNYIICVIFVSINTLVMSPPIEYVVAFSQLYETYNQRFIRFARGYVPTHEIAEDLVNDSFLYYWENKHNITDQHISSYLLTIVKHKCLNYLKRVALEEQARDHFQALDKWELQLKISTLEACNPERLLSDEIQGLVQKALRAMPAQTRDILIRSRYQSQSNKEIAAELHISVKAVEYHITKALKILRTVLKDYFPLWLLYF